jgi:hypothetical protein
MSESNPTRRETLRNIALSVTLGGMPLSAAQHVHNHAAEEKKKAAGVYKPKLFNEQEYKTVGRLAELIIPKDEVSPSALEAGAPEFIDLIGSNNVELATTLTGGLAWLNRSMERRYGKTFLDASPDEQTAMLDLIAFRKNASPELGPGIRFFDWMRRLTADAFYTSPAGIKDVGYLGNKGMSTFVIPEAALQYALEKSPFKG